MCLWLAGRVHVRFLRLGNPAAVRDRDPPRGLDRPDSALLRRVRRQLRIPTNPRRPGRRTDRLLSRAGTAAHAPDRPRSLPTAALPITTEADADAAASMPDLVTGDFTAGRPGVKFVGDITYIHTWQGFIYLATVIDCYSKKVVGWSIADHMRTELVADALRNAAATTLVEPDAIWHSDRGSVYTSAESGAGDRPGDAFFDGPHRRVLGQQHGREFLLDAQERACLSHRVCHEITSSQRCHSLYRRVLQQSMPARRTQLSPA